MSPEGRRTIAWLGEGQVGLLGPLCARAGLELVGVGSPAPGVATKVAGQAGVSAVDDLRAALRAAEADVYLLLDPGDFGAGPDDAALARGAAGRRALIASAEPVPASALELIRGRWVESGSTGLGGQPADAISLLPTPGQAGGRGAWDALEGVGPVRSLLVEVAADPSLASLGALLVGAVGLVRRVLGEPETVDASYAGPESAAGARVAPGDTLRGLTGSLAAHVRVGSGAGAAVLLRAAPGAWSGRAVASGPGGSLTVGDDLVEMVVGGRVVERTRLEPPAEGSASACAAWGASLARELQGTVAADPPRDHAAVLCVAQAALLSARTGQPESPGTIRRIAGLP